MPQGGRKAALEGEEVFATDTLSGGVKVLSRHDRQSADQLPEAITTKPPLAMVLRPSRRRLFLLAFFMAGFFAGGVHIIREGDLRGWFVATAFGAGTLVALILILPGASYLRLAPDGFTICSLYRKSFLRWSDVQDFRVVQIGLNNHYQRAKRSRRFAAAIAACEGALPDNYGLTAEKLAGLMKFFKIRAAIEAAARAAEEKYNP